MSRSEEKRLDAYEVCAPWSHHLSNVVASPLPGYIITSTNPDTEFSGDFFGCNSGNGVPDGFVYGLRANAGDVITLTPANGVGQALILVVPVSGLR